MENYQVLSYSSLASLLKSREFTREQPYAFITDLFGLCVVFELHENYVFAYTG